MSKTYTVRFGTGDPRSFTGLAPTLVLFFRADTGATLVAPSFAEALTGSGVYQFAYGTTTPIAFLADAATTSPGTAGRYVSGQIDPADRADEYGTTMVALGNTAVALGTTAVALGTTSVALGTTMVAIGTSHIAQGVSILAQGVSIFAQGVSITAQGVSGLALGASNFAYGTSNFALGTTTYAYVQTLGSTLVAIGNTSIALSSTILAIAGSGGSLSPLIGTTASTAGDNVTDPSTLFGYMKRVAELIQGQEQFIKGSGSLTMFDRTGATTFVTRTIGNNATLVTKT